MAGVRRFEHPSTVLETAALPIELHPYILKDKNYASLWVLPIG